MIKLLIPLGIENGEGELNVVDIGLSIDDCAS
jgi:hypothetical protein